MLQDKNIPEPEKQISRERYEYVNIDVKGRTKRKLMLIKKKTAAREMFTYFRSQLEPQFSANWQINQLNSLKQCLPENTCLVIHDFSENYRFIEKGNHVNKNELVSELIFCISPYGTHDHFFVTKVQEEIKSHLDSIGYTTDKMI
ncbi:hypothetical protein DPMN_096344 [Dreissena polymorpha]|uniref:Uncharacterized protein n=1 Tax=Dreissena polymorpha TaxID=45954 RepID=A0A9D4L9K5_DREPO|nr:hypothetical protein DPMN_096344 [Dreissena polymorpha]